MNKRSYVVYRHTAPNGKMYVGITKQQPPKLRWLNGRGYINNKYFTNAIIKYGWENFKHEILLSNLTQDEASLAEKLFISYWGLTNPDNGYNITKGGIQNFEISDETRRKLSIAKQGKLNPNYGKNLSGINAPYYGRHHTEETKKRYSEQRRGINNPFYGKKHTEESRLKIRDSLPKCSVAQIDIDTNEIINIFPSQKEAERQTNIYHSNISKCCKGKSKTAGGYKWRYINH